MAVTEIRLTVITLINCSPMLKQLGLSSFFKSNQQLQVDSDSSFSEDSGSERERE